MNIDRLRYFSAVVETRSLRQASEIVGISPPSMSKAISTLESELGFKLLHADGRGTGITPRGMDVYKMATALLNEHQRFLVAVKGSQCKLALQRIGTFEVFSTHFMSAFLAKEEIGDVLVLEKGPGKIEEAILAGSIDLGITYLPFPDPALEYREIGSFEFAVFGHAKWEGQPFEAWPFAIPTTELRLHLNDFESLDMWPAEAPKRIIKFRFEMLETALQTARNGLSVVHCPKFVIGLHNAQVRLPFQLKELNLPVGYKKTKPSKVFLVARKGAQVERLERKLAKFMRQLK